MKQLCFYGLLFGLMTGPAAAQSSSIPQARQGVFALTNARLVTITQGIIENGTLIIRGDRIEALGQNIPIPPEAEVLDATGLEVYPGFIDSGTRLGLTEIESLPETRDYRELGELNPQLEALTAVNPNSVLIPVTRVNGVTTVLTEPEGGLLPGTAALINLFGYTPEHMHLGGVRLMVLQFPSKGRRSPFDRRKPEEIEKAFREAMQKLDEIWDRAMLYARIDSAYRANPERNPQPLYVPEMQALLPVLRGEMPLLLKVDLAPDILAALEWIQKRGLKRVILSGVAEGWRVADKIAAAGIPCLVGPVLALPTRESDRYDKPYANAALLHAAGVKIALRTGEAENVRNLPYHAGFAAAYGLGREAALRAVTINPAEIFGVADQIGSLEAGKKATLFVTDGDPFEPRTQVRYVFIEGYAIPLHNRQLELYHEFLHRQPGLHLQPATR